MWRRSTACRSRSCKDDDTWHRNHLHGRKRGQRPWTAKIASHIGGHTASPNMDVHETGRQTVSPDVASSHASDQICGRRQLLLVGARRVGDTAGGAVCRVPGTATTKNSAASNSFPLSLNFLSLLVSDFEESDVPVADPRRIEIVIAGTMPGAQLSVSKTSCTMQDQSCDLTFGSDSLRHEAGAAPGPSGCTSEHLRVLPDDGAEGQVVPQQWLVHTTAPGVHADDRRRLDVVIHGATTNGTALCCDATLVLPLTRTGQPQPRTADLDGAALRTTERRKAATYPELRSEGPQRFVVPGSEVGGRFNGDAHGLLRDLVRVRACRAPPALRAMAVTAACSPRDRFNTVSRPHNRPHVVMAEDVACNEPEKEELREYGGLQATLSAPEQKIVKPLDFMKVVRDHQRLVHLKVHVVSVGVRDKLTDLEQLEEAVKTVEKLQSDRVGRQPALIRQLAFYFSDGSTAAEIVAAIEDARDAVRRAGGAALPPPCWSPAHFCPLAAPVANSPCDESVGIESMTEMCANFGPVFFVKLLRSQHVIVEFESEEAVGSYAAVRYFVFISGVAGSGGHSGNGVHHLMWKDQKIQASEPHFWNGSLLDFGALNSELSFAPRGRLAMRRV
ncbi:hypothetical protein AK812_SmicGene15349 [Symbiodinium microadriaticum]|uniref:Uncharacterized protein n=1 Tax=Symbiodinium microadriaticum TaxID=2951 RepID=A0A1Q9E369_SYMMI|nr:hypothetical protein AK812_SmicGene15349 [Symbiodinium microadriaticum]